MNARVIEVEFKMPVAIDEPDSQNHIYDINAVKNATKKADKAYLPLIVKNGEIRKVIGHINSVEFSEGSKELLCKGIIYSGGTIELIKNPDISNLEEDEFCQVDEFEFEAFGFSVNKYYR